MILAHHSDNIAVNLYSLLSLVLKNVTRQSKISIYVNFHLKKGADWMADGKSIIWITGASSGIGFALAQKLLNNGHTVIGTARNIDKLHELKKKFPDKLYGFIADITNEQSISDLCLQLKQQFNGIDTMILCAGICEYIEWPNLDLKILHRNMNTNFWGTVNCIAYGMDILNKDRNPYIVAISSASQIVGLPRAEGYGASKAAIHYLLQSLQVELSNTTIDVSIVTPGFVNTELTQKNDFYMPFLIPVEKAADIILHGMRQRKPEIKFPLILILILNILSFIPDKLRIKILSKIRR